MNEQQQNQLENGMKDLLEKVNWFCCLYEYAPLYYKSYQNIFAFLEAIVVKICHDSICIFS